MGGSSSKVQRNCFDYLKLEIRMLRISRCILGLEFRGIIQRVKSLKMKRFSNIYILLTWCEEAARSLLRKD